MKNIVNTNNHKQIYMQYDKNVYLKIETGFVHFCLYLMLGAYGTLSGNLPITRKTMTIKYKPNENQSQTDDGEEKSQQHFPGF